MLEFLKNAAKSDHRIVAAALVLRDFVDGLRLRAGDIETESGMAHATEDLERSIAYVEGVRAGYLARAGVDRFSGAVAEIGPGDNFGVAMLMLGDGARAVHAVDRFHSRRDSNYQLSIYRALAARHGLDRLLPSEATPEAIPGLTYHRGRPAETFFKEPPEPFDAVVSWAVLEHLYDPLGALSDMATALRPGGWMVHQVDLRDHGMFARLHPLTFLRFRPGPYRLMVRNGGRPNRVMLHRYRRWLGASGLRGGITVSHLVGSDRPIAQLPWEEIDPLERAAAIDEVRRFRSRLDREFDGVPDEDLAVSSFALTAIKS